MPQSARVKQRTPGVLPRLQSYSYYIIFIDVHVILTYRCNVNVSLRPFGYDKEIYSQDLQRNDFATYYEDLATPKDKVYDAAYLELCSVRHKIIEQICKENLEQPEPISMTEVQNAISSLNNKEAVGEFGISAEHLKHSGKLLVVEITAIFNQILQ